MQYMNFTLTFNRSPFCRAKSFNMCLSSSSLDYVGVSESFLGGVVGVLVLASILGILFSLVYMVIDLIW
jgi:hypothetical protein